MSQGNIGNLIDHTKSVFETNNINPNLLDNVQTFEEYKDVINNTFGWDSEQTIYLFEGYFRKEERIDLLKTTE